MKIKVQTFAFLREILGSKTIEVETSSQTIGEVLRELGTKNEKVNDLLFTTSGQIKREFVFAVNGDQILANEIENHVLNDGDLLVILPPAGGG